MNASPAPKRNWDPKVLWQKHRGLVISGAITVVVLAGVIIGVAAFGPGASSPTVPAPITQPPSAVDQLLQQAQAAAASGDTTAAAELARQALAADPGNAEAQALLESVESQQPAQSATVPPEETAPGGTTPPPDDGGAVVPPPVANPKPGEPNPTADAGFAAAVSDIGRLLPRSFGSYSTGSPTKSGTEALLTGTPASGSDPASRIIWAVHGMRSQSAAGSFIKKTSAESYPKDKSTASVDGAAAYFGTDGTRFATVSYTRGRYVFEVVVTGNDVPPKSLKKLALEAAAAFPDAPPK